MKYATPVNKNAAKMIGTKLNNKARIPTAMNATKATAVVKRESRISISLSGTNGFRSKASSLLRKLGVSAVIGAVVALMS
jgi:hypothetical protein